MLAAPDRDRDLDDPQPGAVRAEDQLRIVELLLGEDQAAEAARPEAFDASRLI